MKDSSVSVKADLTPLVDTLEPQSNRHLGDQALHFLVMVKAPVNPYSDYLEPIVCLKTTDETGPVLLLNGKQSREKKSLNASILPGTT